MLDKILSDAAEHINQIKNLPNFKEELKEVLYEVIDKLELARADELETQNLVLEKTRKNLDIIEARLNEVEKKLNETKQK